MTCVGKRKNNATVQLNSFDNCNASLVEDEEWVGEQASYHTLFVRVAYNDGAYQARNVAQCICLLNG